MYVNKAKGTVFTQVELKLLFVFFKIKMSNILFANKSNILFSDNSYELIIISFYKLKSEWMCYISKYVLVMTYEWDVVYEQIKLSHR